MAAHKRRAPNTPEPSGGRRRSQRISSSGTKSRYFEPEDSDAESEPKDIRPAKRAKSAPSRQTSAGGRKGRAEKHDGDDEDAYEENDDDEEEEEEEDDDDGGDDKYGDHDSGGRGKVKPSKRSVKVSAEEEDDDDDDEDDGRPRVTFTPYKQMRDTDGVDYEDDRLHKNTMLFLKDLKANNMRTWLKGT